MWFSQQCQQCLINNRSAAFFSDNSVSMFLFLNWNIGVVVIISSSCSDLELIRSDIPFLPSHLSLHSTTFPLMPAPRTPVPTRNSSSSGVVLTTRGGRGLGKFGPLLTILEKKARTQTQPSPRTLVSCTGGLRQMGKPGSARRKLSWRDLLPVSTGSSSWLPLLLYSMY